MKTLTRFGTLAFSLAVMTLALAALLQQPVQAARPAPDCGPTFEWTCVVPGCPDCPVYLFEGTRCEKAAYEKQTGRVCSLG